MGEIYIDGEPMEPMPPAKPYHLSENLMDNIKPGLDWEIRDMGQPWPTQSRGIIPFPTLRQFYAGLAMQGLLANGHLDVVAKAFECADHMIRHEKEHPQT